MNVGPRDREKNVRWRKEWIELFEKWWNFGFEIFCSFKLIILSSFPQDSGTIEWNFCFSFRKIVVSDKVFFLTPLWLMLFICALTSHNYDFPNPFNFIWQRTHLQYGILNNDFNSLFSLIKFGFTDFKQCTID